MTGFRVTQRSIGHRALQNLQANLGKLGELQNKLSSNKELSRPSDSPGGSSDILRLRGQIRTAEQYSRNASDGAGWLSTLDNALTGSLDALNRAQDLTLQGMSSGAASVAGAKTGLAAEVRSLRANLLQVANTKYNSRPVFGGTTSGTEAYDATTGAFLGDTNPVSRAVGDGVSIQVDANGPSVFSGGGTDLFQVLDDIATGLENGTTDLGPSLDALKAATTRVTDALADIGSRSGRIEKMGQSAEDRVLTLTSSLSSVQDIDLPKTIMQLRMQESAYQAALSATTKVIQPSLVDFMR